MIHSSPRPFVILGLFALGIATSSADVRLPALFTDHMVLQQGMKAPVWGWADEGETITVEFGSHKAQTIARRGRWRVDIGPLYASAAPATLKVIGKNALLVDDVLVGEVWIASGQSNMEWPMRLSHEPEPDIQAATNPNLRLFTVPKLRAQAPVTDVASRWMQCVPETVRNFSAVAYYFGRDLQAARGVPVGMIHTSWGGSPAEVWVSHEFLSATPIYVRDILNPYPNAYRNWVKGAESWRQEKDAAEKAGQPFNKGQPFRPWEPSELYQGMIAPLIPYAIKGAIWYQGESNAGRAYQYRSLFRDMIIDWRNSWGEGDFTFLAVQLAPWDRNKKRSMEEITKAPLESDWAELREAQNYAADTMKNVGVAVITDVGDKDDIHPAKKGPVGARLALLARRIAYGERQLVAQGPVFESVSFDKAEAKLTFDTEGSALTSNGEPLTGFAIAGPDHQFVWAEARIDGERRVIVTSPNVQHPVAVRYGWADYPVVNLFNKAGLPASPFRTDDWPMTTEKALQR